MKQQIVSTKLPTLDEAKKLTNFIKRPLNNQVVLIGVVAPKVNSSGINVGEKFQREAQQELNKNGLLVVQTMSESTVVKEGELIMYQPETPAVFSRIVTSDILHEGLDLDEGAETTPDMYKQFLVLVLNASYLTLVLNHKI